MTLDQVLIGAPFVISSLTARGEIRKRLVDMGFVSGAQGVVLRKALLGDPVEIRLGRYLVAVRLTEAQHIQVAPPHG